MHKYNNCFAIGGIHKQPCYIRSGSLRLLNKKTEALIQLYSRYYDDVVEDIRNNFVVEPYWIGDKEQCDTPDVGVYLKNAKYDDLFILVIDIDTKHETEFSKRIEEAADFVTRSKNNGRHAYFGVRRDVELFDSINLLASSNAEGFISKTKIFAADGTQFDVFCDAPHFIYELGIWEPKPLTDKTQVVYDLLKECEIKRSIEYNKRTDANGNYITLEYRDEEELVALMTDKQRLVFEDLKTISPDCPQREWFSIGCDINVVFPYDDNSDIDLGGSVFLWWSTPGETFQPQSCANTWEVICNKDNMLHNTKWSEILEVNAFDLPIPKREKELRSAEDIAYAEKIIHNFLNDEAQEEEEAQEKKPLTFRGEPIKWVETEKMSTKKVVNAFGVVEEERTIKTVTRLEYKNEYYTLRELLAAYFPDKFRKYNKKIIFNTEDIVRIGLSQRRRAAYYAMEHYFDLVALSLQDVIDLEAIIYVAPGNKTQIEKAILNYCRETFINCNLKGVSRLITFGVLPIQNEKVKLWCYKPEFNDNTIQYRSVPRTWEEWRDGILSVIDSKDIEDVYIAVSYQNGVYLTLPRDMREQINDWITVKRGAVAFGNEEFPFSGPINGGEDYSFTIDITTDCTISDIGAGKHKVSEDMAKYNKENAAELAAARGKARRGNAAMKDYERLIGDEWTTKELLSVLGDKKKIKRLVDAELIENVRYGCYRRCKR